MQWLSRLEPLIRNGIVELPGMPPASAEQIRAALGPAPWSGHVKKGGTPAAADAKAVCWDLQAVLQAAPLLEFAIALTPLVHAYLGQEPVCYSLNAFTTRPATGGTIGCIQEWHTDKDDRKFVALFVYLTDVLTDVDGPHQFQVGTHGKGLPDEAGHGPVREIYGPAGTAWLADTSGLHRGLRPLDRERTIAWVRWGVSDPPAAYGWDGLSPIDRAVLGARYPPDEKLQRMLRWVVR